MLSAGQLIWASCRPLIRLVLNVACGFILTKTDNFPPVAARGAGQIMLNIALPCLMFSKIVPAFTPNNISALGPLILVAFLYEAIGVASAWLIKQFFWVPHRFRYGILVAGGWGNVGDIPTSVIVSVTGAAPFMGVSDQNLSIAYISAFILVFMLTLFPAGGSRWVAMDFVGPEVEPEEAKEAVKRHRKAVMYAVPNAISWVKKRRNNKERMDITDCHDSDPEKFFEWQEKPNKGELGAGMNAHSTPQKHVVFHDDAATAVPCDGVRSPVYSPEPTDPGHGINSQEPTIISGETPRNKVAHDALPTTNEALCPTDPTASFNGSLARNRIQSLFRTLRSALATMITPPSLTILFSFPIAAIPPLKGLFVPLPASNSTSVFFNPHIAPGPDGQPPLSILMDTATFIGAASVPLGLICLGAALARLKVPRNQWSSLPIGAIVSLAIAKMIISPVIGVGLVRQLVNSGVLNKNDKVLQFVCIFLSCLPTATTQVYLTQVLSGTGSAEHLPAFLIPQYIIMFFSMTGLTAYTLVYLF